MEKKEIKYVELSANCVITPDAIFGCFKESLNEPDENDNRMVTLKELEGER